jgi:hypothetical protein
MEPKKKAELEHLSPEDQQQCVQLENEIAKLMGSISPHISGAVLMSLVAKLVLFGDFVMGFDREDTIDKFTAGIRAYVAEGLEDDELRDTLRKAAGAYQRHKAAKAAFAKEAKALAEKLSG